MLMIVAIEVCYLCFSCDTVDEDVGVVDDSARGMLFFQQ